MRDLLFLAVIMTMVPLTLRFPMVGVIGWAWTALLAPNDWLYSYMTAVPFNKLFAGVTVLSMLVNARQLHLHMRRELWLIIGLLAVGTMSALLSIDQGQAGWTLYTKFVKILIFAFVIAAVVRNRLDLHALLLAVALGMGFVGVSEGAFYLATAGGHKIVGNPSTGDNNQLAVALLVVLPIVLYLAGQAQVRLVRVIGYGAAALILAAIVGTFSRGGLIGLLALGLFMLAGSRRKLLGFTAMLLVGMTIYVAAPSSWFHRMDTISEAGQDNSFMGRVVAWKISTMIALDHPVFGGGFHAVQHPFAWGYYGSEMSMLDFIPTPPPTVAPHAAHSIYFETLGDLGFTGLFLFLAILVTVLLNGRAVRRLTIDRPDLFWARDLAFALQASIVVFMVAGAAVSVSYTDLLYILVTIAMELRIQVTAATRVPTGAALRLQAFQPARALGGPTQRPAIR